MRNAIRSFWAEPRAPHPPERVWRDWALVAVLVPTAIVETIVRDDIVWPPVAVLLLIVGSFTLLWRRTHPFQAVAVTFGAIIAVDLAGLLGPRESLGLYTMAFVLILPYSLFRWGSGREAVRGIAIMLTAATLGVILDFTGIVDTVLGFGILLFPAELGAVIRYRTTSRQRELEQVKSQEREHLARDLHDTVAHHVSAIAIQAQAGRAVAGSRPEAAVEALAVIEEAASRTLAEMRTMVGALRMGEEPDLAPQRRVADIEQLARNGGDRPPVEVEVSGQVDDLGPSVQSALYRLAQESITNAVRHARHATRISVRVVGDGDSVRLTVSDDGDLGSAARSPLGFGLVGMTERAALLGGTLEAGPSADRGWVVDVVLPRRGSSS